jgi:MFS family permease
MKYVIFFLNCIAILCTLPAQSFGVTMFLNYWIRDFNTDRVFLSFVWLFASIVSGICIMIIGNVLDKIGVKWCVVIIYPLYTACIWMMIWIDELYQLTLLLCFMRIFGPESIGTITYVSLCQWFDKKNHGKVFSALGILDCIFMASPALINYSILSNGWRHTYVLFAVSISICLLLNVIFIKNKEKEEEEVASVESLQPFNYYKYCHLIFNNFIFSIFWSGVNIHAVDYYFRLNTVEIGTNIFIPITIGLILGSFMMGYILDKCETSSKLILLCSVEMVLSFVMFWSLYVAVGSGMYFGFTYGFVVGCHITGYSVILPCLFGIVNLGKIQSINNGIIMFATGMGPLIFSLSKKWSGSYMYSTMGLTILLFFSACVFVRIHKN